LTYDERMKILVVGAKGMLGTMVAGVFAQEKPLLWDKEELDITNFEEVKTKLALEHPDIVINTAAYTAVDKAESEKEMAFAVNAEGPKNLALVCKEIGATLIHYSTDYVFSGTNQEGYAEDDMAGSAVNVYGESKLLGEKAVQESGVNFYILRTAWLYGPNGKNFVETMLELAKTKKELRVINDQWGCPTFTKDVALATKYVVGSKKPFGIYHAVNSGRASWYKFAQEIFRLSQTDINVVPIPASAYPLPTKRPSYSVLKNTKSIPMRSWQEALADYISSKS
jgi:dTDP-4-dehydrorhamnose reductase